METSIRWKSFLIQTINIWILVKHLMSNNENEIRTTYFTTELETIKIFISLGFLKNSQNKLSY